MLSEQTIRVVKSTAPVLVEHGETLTRHFYQRMFTHNPEVKAFFNHSNQAGGTQQRALAGAIVAYAQNIDNLDALGPAVELMAQKHASLGVKEEHYPIVGQHLLASIKEVLGDAATDDIINAWAEAYGFLQGVLVGREGQIYEGHQSHFGWEGFKPFRINRVDRESDCVNSYYLYPEDGQPLAAYKPGQYITVRFPSVDGSTTMRNYSLSSCPNSDYFRISVKHERSFRENQPDGYVSTQLHRHTTVGGVVEVGPPCGEFFLETNTVGMSNKPIVLLCGGIGVTPILPMLQELCKQNLSRKVFVVHGNVSSSQQAFREEFEKLAQENSEWLHVDFRYNDFNNLPNSKPIANVRFSHGNVDVPFLKEILPSTDCEYYICGPKAMMQALYFPLQEDGVSGSQIRFEFFGPLEDLKQPAAAV